MCTARDRCYVERKAVPSLHYYKKMNSESLVFGVWCSRIGERGVPGAVRVAALWSAAPGPRARRAGPGPGARGGVEVGRRDQRGSLGRGARQSALSTVRMQKNGFKIYENGSVI